jgi:hypothetical protein
MLKTVGVGAIAANLLAGGMGVRVEFLNIFTLHQACGAPIFMD